VHRWEEGESPARAEQQADDGDDSEISFHDDRPGRAYYGQEGEVSTGWSVHPWVAEGQRGIRFGVCLGPRSDWPRLLAFAETAERAGLDSYWALDHPMGGTDCWTLLAALAVRTEHLRLGTLVDCVCYRSPAMLARLAADVDRLSGGRLVLGLGIGDAAGEFAQMGLTYPDAPTRQRALEETVRIVLGLWSGAPTTLRGDHARVEGAVLGAGPVQRPRIPLLIAGGGERVTLRQVARYADASNFGAHEVIGRAYGAADVARKLAALRRHCEELGRPYDGVLRTHLTMPLVLAESAAEVERKLTAALPGDGRARYRTSTLAATPDAAVAYYRVLADAGLQYFVATVLGDDRETVRLLGEEVMPRARIR
jgi:alkanesulfonate monooxygenase SsuD/methylene tetrahydromethanopterin reductase-like flavin-dependent oxidoreductase (luciferase family)